jgi:hypothetical protein
LAYSKGKRLSATENSLSVTEIAPTILAWFGVPTPAWMDGSRAPLIAVEAHP